MVTRESGVGGEYPREGSAMVIPDVVNGSHDFLLVAGKSDADILEVFWSH